LAYFERFQLESTTGGFVVQPASPALMLHASAPLQRASSDRNARNTLSIAQEKKKDLEGPLQRSSSDRQLQNVQPGTSNNAGESETVPIRRKASQSPVPARVGSLHDLHNNYTKKEKSGKSVAQIFYGKEELVRLLLELDEFD